eukprot:443422-Prorocentrum_lima.AAC.1
MTSSLVGSEMCIRDSSWAPRPVPTGTNSRPTWPPHAAPASRARLARNTSCLLYTSDAADDM